MKKLTELIKWTVYITVGILIVCSTNVTLSNIDSIPASFLWDILLAGFTTAVVTVLLGPDPERPLKEIWFQYVIHYIALTCLMIFMGTLFDWMDFNLAGIIMMSVSTAIVYAITMVISLLLDVKSADEINKRLKEKYKDEE